MDLKHLTGEYIKAHQRSQGLHELAEQVFAANGATHVRRVLDPFRPYITHAKGSKKWDVDGNEYIDYVLGHGALILGHGHPAVVRAVQQQMDRGVHYGENHELEIEWGGLIKSMMPSMERVEFFSCGQEANLMAIRLARIYTGRPKVLRFEQNFHGWADELIAPAPGVVTEHVCLIPGHDLDRLKNELATREYAVLMVEGGGARMAGQVPWETDFIQALPGLTQKYGTVLLIDEVVTGFRDSIGGWQSLAGVKPDLTSLGKTIGGGLSVGALGGKADIMDILRPRPAPEPFAIHSGTWNANPLTAAAGVAACRIYQTGEVQEKLSHLGSYLRRRGNQILKEQGVSGRLYGRSIIWIYLGPVDYEPSDDRLPPAKGTEKLLREGTDRARLCLHLLHRGIATMGGRFFILSSAHNEPEIDRTIEALGDSLDAMTAEGSLDKEGLKG